jgi:hypothetical protein
MTSELAPRHPRNPCRRPDPEHYRRSPRAGETPWRERTGKAREPRQRPLCVQCGHHAADHRGWFGESAARCELDAECRGYRDWRAVVQMSFSL